MKKEYGANGLADALAKHRNTDAKKGYTSFGPHRADILFYYQDIKVKMKLQEYTQRKDILHIGDMNTFQPSWLKNTPSG